MAKVADSITRRRVPGGVDLATKPTSRGRTADQDVHLHGDVKILEDLFFVLLRNCEVVAGAPTHVVGHDNYIRRRVKHEGLSFFTLSLPAFCSAFERALADGRLDAKATSGFRRRAGLPRFLGGFLRRVFDAKGALLDEACKESVRAVRQLCLTLKKVAAKCSDERVETAFEKFVETDKAIPHVKAFYDGEPARKRRLFARASFLLWSEITGDLGRRVASCDLIPRHGPGATAERIKGNLKYAHRQWHRRLQPYFPIDSYGTSCASELVGKMEEDAEEDGLVDPRDETPVRVISVPKTLKGPRIIAIEPVTMQFLQQSLARPLMSALESSSLLGGSVGFTSQEVNRQMALNASRTGVFATLDLSEASDRVPSWLVADMLHSAAHGSFLVPSGDSDVVERDVTDRTDKRDSTWERDSPYGALLLDAVFACRSTRAQLPDGQVIDLRKFASMGSAMCFPLESMVFMTILVAAWHDAKGINATRRSVHRACRALRVYGDDLIVPRDLAPTVIEHLEAFGLKVNAAKSFWTGKFRESCGMDAYDGHQVTPVYVRNFAPSSRHSVSRLLSWVDLGNQLYRAGFWSASRYVREFVEKIVGELPHVLETSSALGWCSVRGTMSVGRWSPSLHRWEVKGYCVTPVKDRSEIDGYDALFKAFLEMELQKEPDSVRDFRRTVSSVVLARKPRWVTPW